MDVPRLNADRIARALAADPTSLARRPPGSSDFDLDPSARPATTPVLRPAAVLIALIERGPGLNVILTRRATRLKHHPGQVAFPGGKVEPFDASPMRGALREAQEEIGLAPDSVTVIGELDPHETVTHFTVIPFVGLVTGPFRPEPERREVDEVFEAPLDFLLEPANLQTHRRRWRGGWRQYYAIPYGPHYIWGASARIIKTLADRMQDP